MKIVTFIQYLKVLLLKRKAQLYLLLALSSMLFTLSPSQAQQFLGAVMGGMNISQVDGDEVYGYRRVGGHLGAAVILPINNFDITLETVFNQKGAYQKQTYTDSVRMLNGKYDLRLNYLEVPILAHYTDKKIITAGAGFSWGRLVSFKEIEHNGWQNPYSDTVAFSKNDFNILIDVQLRIYKKLKFNVRFAYSIVPLRERTFTNPYVQDSEPWTRKQYNNMFTFRLVYVFNERDTPRREENPGQ
jgi:hypothetical protein